MLYLNIKNAQNPARKHFEKTNNNKKCSVNISLQAVSLSLRSVVPRMEYPLRRMAASVSMLLVASGHRMACVLFLPKTQMQLILSLQNSTIMINTLAILE